MNLQAGQRYVLRSGQTFARIVSGKAEAYAVNRDSETFRQIFLTEAGAGQAVFPADDEFDLIDIVVYALEDVVLETVDYRKTSPDELKNLARVWFKQLIGLPWLRILADKGDDMLVHWIDGSLFAETEAIENIWQIFAEHEHIFSMLIGVRLKGEDVRLGRRMKARKLNKQRILHNAIGNLLGEGDNLFVGAETGTETLEEATFAVRRVASFFKMPTDNIHLSAEIIKKLDQVGILRRLIQKGGMQMRLITLEENWQKNDSGIIIGYYGAKKELAVFIPLEPGKYKIVTKTRPEGIYLTDEEEKKLDRSAFACYAGFPSRALKIMDLLKFMFYQCWKSDYRTIIVISLFAGLIPLITPMITETVFQDIIPILDRQGLATVTQAMLVTSFTMAALSVVRSIAVMRITTHIDMATEAALWARLLTLPTKFFRKFMAGEMASRMRGIEAAKGIVSGEFAGTIFNFIFSFWSIFLMCYYSVKLAAVAVAVWFVYAIITAFIYRRVIGFQRKLIDAGNKSAGLVQQIFAGLAKFRVQGAEEQAYHLWSKVFGESWKWNLKLRWQSNYNTIIGSIQPFILNMSLYYMAVYGMQEMGPNGEMVTGIGYAQFLAFSAAFTSFNGTLGAIVPLIGQFFAIQPHIENLRPIMNEVPESFGEKNDAGVLSGVVEVSHLSFAYNEGRDVLHDLNFRIKAGENVAIVGKSGCGKSTLVRLLLGFEEPRQGAIYLDGQDMAGLNLPSVRTQMGVVLQNGQLMTGDIFTNIVGTLPLTQDDAWEAADAAGIAEDIAAMPMGMQTIISEGSTNISGGQRQRIMIARALVNKPAILIFDEATSALDNRTQAIVTDSLNRLKATRIIVAHRLSTIRECDRIIVMDAGRIVETGKFDELVAQNGIFADLVRRQVA